VALVNQEFVRQVSGGSDPLGQSIVFGGGTAVWSIVGVVGDVHQRALGDAPKPEVYAPLAERGGPAEVMLVRAGAVRSLLPALRTAIRQVDAEQPIAGVRTLAETRAESLAAPRATAALLTIAAILALVIAATGLAGLLAYSLNRRQREFGIRQAFGAGRADIARLVLTHIGALVGVGTVFGLGGALLATRSLGSMLFGLAASDPQTYAVVTVVLGSAALLASLPALRRALSMAPNVALRAL
jgi:putative ABC transport system permease protein